MPCARVCGMANMGNMGGRAETGGAVLSPPSLPCCPVPGQNLTRSLGRQASPEPFLLLSGAGTPACQRGSGPGGRQNSWAQPSCMTSQGTLTGYSTPCLTGPICHAGDSLQLSQTGHPWAGLLAFLAQEAEGCWCTAHPVPGAGGAAAECHKPTFL